MNSPNLIRIMLVDDHAVVRAGIKRLLEQDAHFSIVAEAESGERAYQLFGEYLPDITIMDLSMPGMGGFEAINRIVMRYPTAKLLVLSMHENTAFAHQAIKAGAKGYLTKNGLAEELVNALLEISNGQSFISASMIKKINLETQNNEKNPTLCLSTREFEIFRMLAEGVDSNLIATQLHISIKTVANYQTNIKHKLDITNSTEMVRLAIRHKVIEG